jgi:hypothetical protein
LFKPALTGKSGSGGLGRVAGDVLGDGVECPLLDLGFKFLVALAQRINLDIHLFALGLVDGVELFLQFLVAARSASTSWPLIESIWFCRVRICDFIFDWNSDSAAIWASCSSRSAVDFGVRNIAPIERTANSGTSMAAGPARV